MSDSRKISTVYLLPHAHTDIGYSHDPVVAMELHDRFLDRAISLCEKTRNFPEGARFRWTVEVFFQVFHWWDRRDEEARSRLMECLRRGEIAIGARYLNGTEAYSAEDVNWEIGEFKRLGTITGTFPDVAIQNDVNGFPIAFATQLASRGVKTLLMGLNTTMGHSPFRRCEAFHWQLPDDQKILVWNGWIYNRIKTFCHLDRLAADLPGKLASFLGGLPDDYPYDFAVASATMGDNVGPFSSLPDQVCLFSAKNIGTRIQLATFSEFAKILTEAVPDNLPEHAGNWPDFWTFGAGSMPQMMASVRRAQRRLHIVEQIRHNGWANEQGGSLTLDLARRALARACEHTYDSHSSAGAETGGSDSLRQKAQTFADASVAESSSMVLLRDHLGAIAEPLPANPIKVLVVNPHPWEISLDYLSNEQGLRNFATSRCPEHLFQFDREPTYEAFEKSATYGALNIIVPARSHASFPLQSLPGHACTVLDPATRHPVAGEGCSLEFDPGLGGLISWKTCHGEALQSQGEWSSFAPVIERPLGEFQTSGAGMQTMDPSDCAWNPALTFSRSRLPGAITSVTLKTLGSRKTLDVSREGSQLQRMQFTLDERNPNRLEVAAEWCFATDTSLHSIYLPLLPQLPDSGDTEYWIDSCGSWFRAETDQIPGTCNSFYQAARGVAVTRGGATLYVAPADTSLFQCGGFTFSQLPSMPLNRKNPFLLLWIYNNYWTTNYPSCSPGQFSTRFAFKLCNGPFSPTIAARLASAWDSTYLTHPVA